MALQPLRESSPYHSSPTSAQTMANEFIQPTAAIGQTETHTENTFSWSDAYQKYSYLALVGFTTLLIYSFWNTLETTSAFWQRAQYSHGYIVPLIALYLMWSRRPNPTAQEPHEGQAEETFFGLVPASIFWWIVAGASVAQIGLGMSIENQLLQGTGIATACIGMMAYVLIGQPFQPVRDLDRWIGFAVIIVSYAVRILVGAEFEVEPINRLCLLTSVAGLFLMVGGWNLIGWAGPAVGFLIFMFPLPTRIEQPLLLGLQKIAAVASEIVLTILNMPVVRQNNVITVDNVPLTVAEACSGLRMMTIFGAMAVAMVFLIKRPWWDRFIILVSAIPIALFVNITRIVVTALLYYWFPENDIVHTITHDGAGLAMMPLALGLMFLELKILSMLSIPDEGSSLQAATT